MTRDFVTHHTACAAVGTLALFVTACGAAGTEPATATATATATAVGTAPSPADSGAAPRADPGLNHAEQLTLRRAGLDPAALACNSRCVWDSNARDNAKDTAAVIIARIEEGGARLPDVTAEATRHAVVDLVMWRMVRAVLISADNNNAGVVALRGITTTDGRPVLLFRGGLTPEPGASGSCVSSLIEAGGVRHIVNLYAGEMPTADLEQAERTAIEAKGGTCWLAGDVGGEATAWRDAVRKSTDAAGLRAAMPAIARIVNDQILRPGGGPPAGNVFVHCGGGMHRTGMVFGVVEKCVNGTDIESVIRRYRRHVAWRNASDPGGYEASNEQLLRDFDCTLVQAAPQ